MSMNELDLDAYFKRRTEDAEALDASLEPLVSDDVIHQAAKGMAAFAFDRLLGYLDDPRHRASQLVLLDKDGEEPGYDAEEPHTFSIDLDSDLHIFYFHYLWERISALRVAKEMADAYEKKGSVLYMPERTKPLRLTPDFQDVLKTDTILLEGKTIPHEDPNEEMPKSVHLQATVSKRSPKF